MNRIFASIITAIFVLTNTGTTYALRTKAPEGKDDRAGAIGNAMTTAPAAGTTRLTELLQDLSKKTWRDIFDFESHGSYTIGVISPTLARSLIRHFAGPGAASTLVKGVAILEYFPRDHSFQVGHQVSKGTKAEGLKKFLATFNKLTRRTGHYRWVLQGYYDYLPNSGTRIFLVNEVEDSPGIKGAVRLPDEMKQEFRGISGFEVDFGAHPHDLMYPDEPVFDDGDWAAGDAIGNTEGVATPAPAAGEGERTPAAMSGAAGTNAIVRYEINEIHSAAQKIKDRYRLDGIVNWMPSVVEAASAVLSSAPSNTIKDVVILAWHFAIRTSGDELQMHRLTQNYFTPTELYATLAIEELQQKPIGKTALIIDTKQERRERLRGILSQMGFIVTVVESIQQAKEDFTGAPDVIINNVSRDPYEAKNISWKIDYDSIIQLRSSWLDEEAVKFRVLSVLVATEA